MEELEEILLKAPKWADGIIVSSGSVYPIKASRYGKDQYYFSPMWRTVSEEGGEERVLMLKNGEKYKYKQVKDNGRYITVEIIHEEERFL